MAASKSDKGTGKARMHPGDEARPGCIRALPVPLSDLEAAIAHLVLEQFAGLNASDENSIRPLCNRSARELLQPLGQFVELPLARQCRGFVPARLLFADRGKRRARIHRGDTLVEEQVFRLASKTAGGDRLF